MVGKLVAQDAIVLEGMSERTIAPAIGTEPVDDRPSQQLCVA